MISSVIRACMMLQAYIGKHTLFHDIMKKCYNYIITRDGILSAQGAYNIPVVFHDSITDTGLAERIRSPPLVQG